MFIKENKHDIIDLSFHSAGQPLDIPLHDSELVYLVEKLRHLKFGKLAKSLKIPEKDLEHIPSDNSTLTREMQIDILRRWRDEQKDSVEARSTLAQCLADKEVQEANTGAKITQGNIDLTKGPISPDWRLGGDSSLRCVETRVAN